MTFNLFLFTVIGASKKKAKHLASYYVLLNLLNEPNVGQQDKNLLQSLHSSAASILGMNHTEMPASAPVDGEDFSNMPHQPINFVSKIQEHCDKNSWPPPSYEFAQCPASVYGGSFQCKVRLWKWEFLGYGGSKKEAKRKAAAEMLKEVVERGLTIPTDAIEAMEEANLPLVQKEDLEALKDKQSTDDKAGKAAKKILSGVFTSHGRLQPIDIENISEPTLNVYETLDHILEEKRLAVFYSYTTASKSGKFS